MPVNLKRIAPDNRQAVAPVGDSPVLPFLAWLRRFRGHTHLSALPCRTHQKRIAPHFLQFVIREVGSITPADHHLDQSRIGCLIEFGAVPILLPLSSPVAIVFLPATQNLLQYSRWGA